MTGEQLKQIEERCNKATTGPWKGFWRGNTVKSHYIWSPVEQKNICSSISPKTKNADFIAHARQDIPDLLAYVRELQTAARSVIKNSYQYSVAPIAFNRLKDLIGDDENERT
jgi:hypothetical protein